jgi:hypothetical protein
MARRQGLPPRRVMAWGRSVLASALVAGLATRTGLELMQVEGTVPAALDVLRRRRPHAVVCDLASVPAAGIVDLLEASPSLMVVVVNPDAERGLVLTGHQLRLRTIDDLVTVLLDGVAF